MKVLILLLVAGAWAVPPRDHRAHHAEPKCTVGDWGDWGQCTVVSGCGKMTPPSGHQSYSFPAVESDAWDQGRDAMTETMKRKAAEWSLPVHVAAEGFSGRHQCVDGMAGECQCINVDQLAFLSIEELGYESMPGDRSNRGNDIWGWTDPMTGDEYAIMGVTGGTSFVRITDPENPFTVAFMYTTTVATSWRDIKVIGDFAYVGSEARDHGMQVFDLRRLRGVNSFISHAEPDVHYAEVGNSHNVVSNEETEFIYLVGCTASGGGSYTPCSGGLHAVDVSDPLNPTFAGCYSADGYTHDAQCVVYRGPDARYFEHELCFAFNEDSLTIVDVSDKSNMHMISKRAYEGVAYSHQGWVSEDMALLLLDDELDEGRGDGYTRTFIWDIHNLENPVLMTTHQHPHQSIDHNQYVRGPFTYQANYESGLRIMYIDRENWDIREVAFFDVRPDQTTPNFNGAWSVYPYFKSGTVVISSIDYGLFIVRPNYQAMEMEMMSPTPQATQTRQRSLVSEQKGSYCPALGESRVCKAKCD